VSYEDPLDLRAQEQVAAERSRVEKLATAVEASDLKWLMANRRGRRIVRRQLDWSSLYMPIFDSDEKRMYLNEGIRQVGLRWYALLMEHCPQQYLSMMTEKTTDE
jgi:hypothetical protein